MNEDELRNRIVLQMKRAWWSLLEEELNSTPPKWDHLKVVLRDLSAIVFTLFPIEEISTKKSHTPIPNPPSVVLQERALYWIKNFNPLSGTAM